MAAFPFSHPADMFRPARFRLQRSVVAVPSGAGRMNYSEVNDPVWTISFQSAPLYEDEIASLDAWRSNLRGGLRSTRVTQNVTCRPFAHSDPADAAPAQDPGILNGVTNGNVLTVGNVSSALVLQGGDLIGLEEGAYRGLHRVISVSGAGTTRSITVEPPPRSYVAVAGAVVRFEQPELNMRLAPDSWSVSEDDYPLASFQFVESRS